MAARRYIIAVDSGTTSSRALLFDLNGHRLLEAKRELKCSYPQSGYVDLDPNDIYSSVVDSVNDVLIRSGLSATDIIALALTNQRETTLLFDRKTGRPLTEAIVWQSKETEPIIERYRPLEQLIRSKTGLKVSPYFSASKISCLLDKYGLRERARHGEVLAGTVDAYLIYRLTGGRVFATDVTNASRTLLYNIFDLRYDEELLGLFDIPAVMLPEVRMSDAGYGATEVFPGGEIAICGVAGDQQAALFGHRLFDKGGLKNTYGTGLFTLLNIGSEPFLSRQGLLTTVAAGLKGTVTYALEGSVFIGGAAIQWLRDELGVIERAEESEACALEAAADRDVYVVPAFSGLGTPYWDERCRGAVFGLTRATSKAVLVKATLESIAFESYDVIATMAAEAGLGSQLRLYVDGGATANSYLMQFQADLLQRPLYCPEMKETTALGAFFLAGLGTGVFASLDDIKKLDMPCECYVPRMDADEAHSRLERWRLAIRAARMFE